MNEEQDTTLSQRLRALEVKIDAIHESVEKMLSYFRITLWITVAVVVVPLFGLAFVLPAFLRSYLGALDGLL